VGVKEVRDDSLEAGAAEGGRENGRGGDGPRIGGNAGLQVRLKVLFRLVENEVNHFGPDLAPVHIVQFHSNLQDQALGVR
jgi:hypothetical protein